MHRHFLMSYSRHCEEEREYDIHELIDDICVLFVFIDVNECIDPTACGDQCVNNIGGHECECKEGRVAVDTQNCRGKYTINKQISL